MSTTADIADELTKRGFHKLNQRRYNLDNYLTGIMYLILIILVGYKTYQAINFYPREVIYLVKHPISEILYILSDILQWWWIYILIYVISKIIYYGIAIPIYYREKQIYYEVYAKYGVEPPKYSF